VLAVQLRAPDGAGRPSFRDEDVSLLEALAGYASLALENARLADEVGRLEGLRELDRLKAEFLQTVSHELRTPLSLIHGYAELLATRDAPAELVREMGAQIHRGSTSMVHMVDDLLDFSRLETGRFALQLAPVDLRQILASVGAALVDPSPTHCLSLELPPEPLLVAGDGDRLHQVVVNLVSNAVRYSTGGEVALRARLDENQVQVEVEDHGIGIALDDQPRVFEKFFRARQTIISEVRGAGLGLTISRHLIEAHGGTIDVRSIPGQGSVFTFSLPAAGAGPMLRQLHTPARPARLPRATSKARTRRAV
jgi:signal transduction histidine kinase